LGGGCLLFVLFFARKGGKIDILFLALGLLALWILCRQRFRMPSSLHQSLGGGDPLLVFFFARKGGKISSRCSIVGWWSQASCGQGRGRFQAEHANTYFSPVSAMSQSFLYLLSKIRVYLRTRSHLHCNQVLQQRNATVFRQQNPDLLILVLLMMMIHSGSKFSWRKMLEGILRGRSSVASSVASSPLSASSVTDMAKQQVDCWFVHRLVRTRC
jgi:hypothetical protein